MTNSLNMNTEKYLTPGHYFILSIDVLFKFSIFFASCNIILIFLYLKKYIEKSNFLTISSLSVMTSLSLSLATIIFVIDLRRALKEGKTYLLTNDIYIYIRLF